MLQSHFELPLLVAYQTQIIIGHSRSRHPLYSVFETVCGLLELALLLEGYTQVEQGLRRPWIER
jgi:hypothetical protein